MRVTARIVDTLQDICRDYIQKVDKLLKEVFQAMLQKPGFHRCLVHTDAARFVRVPEPMFRTNIIIEKKRLQAFVTSADVEKELEAFEKGAWMRTFVD